ncbi:hypothetical protein TVAG_038340 [Trichomonas vaginalis G3]|uniref:LisH domain-containing protein n=1 Tax=Trichomonas vaginalis (strain ATCC PRA-98 / G3) TaxID=412133 RepID=A2DXZ2_TRIV3|nr:hypothetical protein TVAGG3_0960960 [Trichomonas vaginalis G3]EAY14728.1 hypothetical protein TVAG_038340 [Trichomonas vaginalis G3]KAI5487901.1 hypothetical protein TVAGG3_0960960 [Trichomonas vaginalis G3]|eukprot:XP_001326951.1 hypothetical protein [Trichomonas vaginalis G3]
MSKAPTQFSAKSKIYASLHQDEIADRTRQAFEKAGGPNHFQSKTVSLAAKEVVGSKEHKFCTLQPRITPIDNDPWKDGFSLVVAFLKHYKMQNTLDTIMTELGSSPFPEQKHVYDPNLTETYFKQLTDLQENFAARDFEQNVMNFMEDIKYEDALQFSPLVSQSPISKKRPLKYDTKPVQKGRKKV